MKKIFYIAIIFCSLMSIESCKKDKCEEQYCLNGGVCYEGDCECPTGYSGVHCETTNNNGGGGNCNFTPYYGPQNCSTGVAVSSTSCCSTGYPYYCSTTNQCYTSCDAAEAAGCGSISFGTGQTGGGSDGYNCVSGTCSYSSSGGSYSTLSQCQSSCANPGSGGYNCNGGSCTYSSSGGSYSTLTQCQTNCGNPSTSGYNCNGSTCTYVNSGASYSSLSICQSSCTPSTGQLTIWNSNSQPCPAGAGSTISIYIDGSYAGGISTYFSSAPSCGASGTVTKNVTPGNHSVSGTCGSTNWGPTSVNVSAGGCFTLELY